VTARIPTLQVNKAMSPNKQTVQAYMEAFTRTDHPAILACLTDDVEWVIPGAFRLTGKRVRQGDRK
jgi:ketosteroid isomerase-like protein